MSVSFVRRTALVAAALPLLLAGCTEDEPVPQFPDPTTPTRSPSASETTTAAPVEPTLPPEAQGTGAKAAEAFVRHYYAMVNYAQATGDTRSLRALATKYCEACSQGASALEDIYKQGGEIEGGENSVDRAKVTGVRSLSDGGSLYYLRVVVSVTDQTVSGSKELDGTYLAGSSTYRFEIMGSSDSLHISRWYTP